ncbi:hypothetical protein L1049_018885 [Liquidambar formosana]|uniref:Uncharacterized protein n=1 Tax=Liquidambar formosana TaxID=63359 RepID=A0AAP0RAP9_LIQFO
MSVDLVPNSKFYMEVRMGIQRHCDDTAKPDFARFIHEHFYTPNWTLTALFGAVLAIALTVVQTYYTIFPIPGDCDGLCNHLTKATQLK